MKDDTVHLIVLGMSHKTAGVAVRERLAGQELTLATNAEIMHAARVSGMVVISTCNRTELYVEAETHHELLKWFADRLAVDILELNKYTYMYSDFDAIRHLMRLACGLDSMVIGEVEILGQLKAAYKTALQHGTVTKTLGRLFENAFAVAKQVRSETEIGLNPISVAYLAVRLAQRIFTDIAAQTVLLIGAGDTARLMLRHLAGAGVKRFMLANRTLANSQALVQDLAQECGSGIAVDLLELNLIPDALARADIVVTTTSAPLPLVGKGMVERAIKARKYKSMFMIDLAVPRNIEPQVQQISDVYLYGIDDLQSIAAEHQRTRHTAVPQAEMIITREMQKFIAWLDSRHSITAIQAFRQRCELRRDQALLEAMQQLEGGRDPKQVLEKFAHVLLNKLLHEPTVQLRKAGIAGNNELLHMMRELFEEEV